MTLGTSLRYQSGYPVSLKGGNNRYPGSFPVYIIPRGLGGRIEANYNWNARPPVVMVKDGDARLIRRRETFDDMMMLDVLE